MITRTNIFAGQSNVRFAKDGGWLNPEQFLPTLGEACKNAIEGVAMKTYEFDIQLREVSEISDEVANALFVEGCDDGTPVSRDGVAWIHFDRSAPSLEEAIRQAVRQVEAAGLSVAKVELDAQSMVCLG